jgi:chromosome partitioning protein
MSLRTLAVIARKGGSGKTTIAIHLAIGGFLRGRKTLLADMDAQKSALDVLKSRRRPGPDRVDCTGSKLFAQKVAADRQGYEDLIVDTSAGEEDEMASAVSLADLSILVVRPTYLDIASAAQTARVLQRLRRPAVIVVNQAQSPRNGGELPAVARAREALGILNLPICPTIIRSRTVYQSALEKGFSAEECDDLSAIREIGGLIQSLSSITKKV